MIRTMLVILLVGTEVAEPGLDEQNLALHGTPWKGKREARSEAETRLRFLETVQPRETASVGKGSDSDTFS